MASPAGRDENKVTASQATPVSDKPTQTPLPKISSRLINNSAVMAKSLITSFVAQSLCGRDGDAFTTQFNQQLVNECNGQNNSACSHCQLRNP